MADSDIVYDNKGTVFNIVDQGGGSLSSKQTQTYQTMQEAVKGVSGFGSEVSVDVSFSPTQPNNFWGYWIRPDGVVVDTRRQEGKSFFNKILSPVVPIIIAAGAVAATGGTALGAGGAAFGAALASSTTGASGAKIALSAIAAYAGATAWNYIKNAVVNSGIASADTVANASESEILDLASDLPKETVAQIAEDTGYSSHFDAAIRAGDTSINSVTEGLGLDPSDVLQTIADAGGDATGYGAAPLAGGAAAAGGGAAIEGAGEVGSTIGTIDPSLTDPIVDIGDGSILGGMDTDTTGGSSSWLQKLMDATGLSASDLAKLGISVGTGVASLAGGGDGGSLSETNTTSSLPDYVKADAEKIWDDYLTDFYGLKARYDADEAYKKGANDTYLGEAQSAWQPYQQLLTDAMAQQKAGTGDYTPFTLSFGGKPATTFVPKPQRDTAQMKLDTGKESAGVGAGLAELKNTLALKTLPGAAADKYSTQLAELMKYVTGGDKTSTSSVTMPEQDTWTKVLNALGLGTSVYSNLFKK